jgi:competence protein ComEC
VIDVGQGDAVGLRTPGGRWVLFDAGRAGRGADGGARAVVPYLRRRGGQLVGVVLSHAHADHVGGAAEVIRRLRPAVVWDAGFALGSDTYRDVLAASRGAGARWRRVRPGDSLALDGVVLRVLAPDSAWTAGLSDPNSASVVVSVRYGRVRFLLVGDAEAAEEGWLAARAAADPGVAAALRADVLKVAHHGSRTSTTDAFVGLVRPRLALVSVGAANGYGHPSAAVLDRLRRAGAEVLRTDRDGSVIARTDGAGVEFSTTGGEWQTLVRAPDPGQ